MFTTKSPLPQSTLMNILDAYLYFMAATKLIQLPDFYLMNVIILSFCPFKMQYVMKIVNLRTENVRAFSTFL